jgi:hypothetical protein
MIVRPIKVTRPISRAVGYLLSDKDHAGVPRAKVIWRSEYRPREYAALLAGASTSKRTYDHTTLSFVEPATPKVLSVAWEVVSSYLDLVFLGVPGGTPSAVTLHIDPEGRPHFHILVARIHILTGKQYSSFSSRSDLRLLSLWQSYENTRHNLGDPCDPAFARDFPYLPYSLTAVEMAAAQRAQSTLQTLLETTPGAKLCDAKNCLSNADFRTVEKRKGLSIVVGDRVIAIATESFGQPRPKQRAPGAPCAWFRPEQELEYFIARRERIHRQLKKYSVFEYTIDAINEFDLSIRDSFNPRARRSENGKRTNPPPTTDISLTSNSAAPGDPDVGLVKSPGSSTVRSLQTDPGASSNLGIDPFDVRSAVHVVRAKFSADRSSLCKVKLSDHDIHEDDESPAEFPPVGARTVSNNRRKLQRTARVSEARTPENAQHFDAMGKMPAGGYECDDMPSL